MTIDTSCEKDNTSQNSFAFGMSYGHSKNLKLRKSYEMIFKKIILIAYLSQILSDF